MKKAILLSICLILIIFIIVLYLILENNKEERMQDTKNLNEDSIMKVNAKIILRK